MDDWNKQLWQGLTSVGEEIEQFWQQTGEWIEDFAEEIIEVVEVISEPLQEIHNSVITDLIQQLEILWDESGFDDELWIEENFFLDEDDYLYPHKQNPSLTHPACVGCRHYHGRVYNGNLFVCAMHPYGWEDQNCPDWEKTTIDQQGNDFFF